MEKHVDTSGEATAYKDIEEHKTKKRRLHGACDACRKKKSAFNILFGHTFMVTDQ